MPGSSRSVADTKASAAVCGIQPDNARQRRKGPTLAPEELAVRKTLALYGRAEPRDFIDVYVLHQRFDRDATLRRAAEADRGFDPELFGQTLRTHARIDDLDFPDVGVAIADVRAYFDAWAKDLVRRQAP